MDSEQRYLSKIRDEFINQVLNMASSVKEYWQRLRKRYVFAILFIISSLLFLTVLQTEWTVSFQTLDLRHGVGHGIIYTIQANGKINKDKSRVDCTTADERWHYICMDQMKKFYFSQDLNTAERSICISTFLGDGFDSLTSIITLPRKMQYAAKTYADSFCAEIIELNDRIQQYSVVQNVAAILLFLGFATIPFLSLSRLCSGSRRPYILSNTLLLLSFLLILGLWTQSEVASEMLDLIPSSHVLKTPDLPIYDPKQIEGRITLVNYLQSAITNAVKNENFEGGVKSHSGTIMTTVKNENVTIKRPGIIVAFLSLSCALVVTLFFIPVKCPTYKTKEDDKNATEGGDQEWEWQYAWAYVSEDFTEGMLGDVIEEEDGFVDMVWGYYKEGGSEADNKKA